ncbi:MAG: two-component system sensor histidine kinase PilS (NtrC family) [Bradymonadia bacterium]|jgi:two-component system sensor histidine kinase PilS (NtrC family)
MPAPPIIDPPAAHQAPAAPNTPLAATNIPYSAQTLQRMMLLRVLLITLFLGSNLVLSARDSNPFADPAQQTLLWLIGITYGLTIVYALVLDRVGPWLHRFALVQLAIDLGLVAVVVSLTGGTESSFLFLYTLVALAAAVLLGRRGARFAMVIAIICILVTVALEAFGPVVSEARTIITYQAGILHISAVALVAVLGGYLTEKVRVTDRELKVAGQQLRYASVDLMAVRALNANLIGSIHSGLFGYALDGQIIFFNPSAVRITGRLTQDVLDTRADVMFASLAAQPETAEVVRWETNWTRPDGVMRTLGMSRSPLLDGVGDQIGWIVIFRDLSRIRQLETQIRRAEKFAAIGRMAAGIAHEIRNPLASMSGSIQMMGAADPEPMQARLMDIVLREIDRLNQLISDFLQFARPTPSNFERLDVAALIGEVKVMFDASARPVDLQVITENDCLVSADSARLRQVLWNLFINAADAMPDGGTVHVHCHAREHEVEISVRDTGVGIPADVIEHIFDPFYTTKAEGTGLGLAQVQRILEEHGAPMRIQSEIDEGTAFIFALPRTRAELPLIAHGGADLQGGMQ